MLFCKGLRLQNQKLTGKICDSCSSCASQVSRGHGFPWILSTPENVSQTYQHLVYFDTVLYYRDKENWHVFGIFPELNRKLCDKVARCLLSFLLFTPHRMRNFESYTNSKLIKQKISLPLAPFSTVPKTKQYNSEWCLANKIWCNCQAAKGSGFITRN